MSIDYHTLGPVPADENCAQVGRDDFRKQAIIEMDVYIDQLWRLFPEAQDKRVWFSKKWFEHDFGQYGEVVAKWNDEDTEATNYVFDVIDRNLPEHWDEEAIKELKGVGLL